MFLQFQMNYSRDTQGLDCFCIFLFRVFFVNEEPLSSNIRFFRPSVARISSQLVPATCYGNADLPRSSGPFFV